MRSHGDHMAQELSTDFMLTMCRTVFSQFLHAFRRGQASACSWRVAPKQNDRCTSVEMATHSSTLVWKIPGTVGCSPWGLGESDTTERLHFHFHQHWASALRSSARCLDAGTILISSSHLSHIFEFTPYPTVSSLS